MTVSEALALIERIGSGEDRFAPPFCEACNVLEQHMRRVDHAELARLLLFIEDNDCYYHHDICTMKDAALKEAAARLRSIEQSR